MGISPTARGRVWGGLAYDARGKRLFVASERDPRIYEDPASVPRRSKPSRTWHFKAYKAQPVGSAIPAQSCSTRHRTLGWRFCPDESRLMRWTWCAPPGQRVRTSLAPVDRAKRESPIARASMGRYRSVPWALPVKLLKSTLS